MKILGLSEHYFPRVGGTTRTVHETCFALAALGHKVHLLVPGPRPALMPYPLNYDVTWIDAGYRSHGDPPRRNRYAFCSLASRIACESARRREIDVVHVMFGLFLMEVLATSALSRSGVASVATVHSVPPRECGRSWPGQMWYMRARESLRLKLVTLKNEVRLRRHRYDAYVVPSEQTRNELSRVLPSVPIHVISHGSSADLLVRMSKPKCRRPQFGEPMRLLTVGGWGPHKRQHLIPEVAAYLRASGRSFRWTIAGPSGRVYGYKAAVDARIGELGLADLVATRDAVPPNELAALYDAAHLYVQPSAEEGFCITALDAAAAGLPVIGTPAGAIPQICAASDGRLVSGEVAAIAKAIASFQNQEAWPDDASSIGAKVRALFSWDLAAQRLSACYETCAGTVTSCGTTMVG